MVPHTESKNSLVNSKSRCKEDKVLQGEFSTLYKLILYKFMVKFSSYGSFLVNGLDDKLFIVERDVSDLGPWESNLRGELVVFFVDVETKSIHAQPEISAFLVLDAEIVDSIHF